jgi:hypothetical protein
MTPLLRRQVCNRTSSSEDCSDGKVVRARHPGGTVAPQGPPRWRGPCRGRAADRYGGEACQRAASATSPPRTAPAQPRIDPKPRMRLKTSRHLPLLRPRDILKFHGRRGHARHRASMRVSTDLLAIFPVAGGAEGRTRSWRPHEAGLAPDRNAPARVTRKISSVGGRRARAVPPSPAHLMVWPADPPA